MSQSAHGDKLAPFQFARSSSLELDQSTALNQAIEIREREDLSASGQKKFLHVFAVVRLPALHAKRCKVLDTRHLVPRRAIVFGKLRFDNDLRVNSASAPANRAKRSGVGASVSQPTRRFQMPMRVR